MGSGESHVDYESLTLGFYESALDDPCLLPDVGIDESLLIYSGSHSNYVLQTYSNDLANSIPGFIDRLGSSLAPLAFVPNAVGIGALVISMVMEICIKSGIQTNDRSYGFLQRVFGEEKASSVRDTMSEYVRRHRTFLNDDRRLLEELRRLESQLSNHLTILKNSLLHDGQMSTRGFKIWVNGASFHLQMLVHEARLNIQTGRRASDYDYTLKTTIRLYLEDLDILLKEYKTYKTNTAVIRHKQCYKSCKPPKCVIENRETNCKMEKVKDPGGRCSGSGMVEAYMDHVFSKYEPILALKNHFSNIERNLNFLTHQRGLFTLPSTRSDYYDDDD